VVKFPIHKRDKKISQDGYVLVHVPEHPKSFNGWYYEHRIILEQYYNRPLRDWETIHHINGDKTDNRVLNLFLCTEYEHKKAHRT
jgi:hypothetical protein